MKIEQVIFKTLVYADIFSWPLKEEEIRKYLISKNIDASCNLRTVLDLAYTSGKIKEYKKYYFLPGRKQLIQRRKEKEKWASQKIKLAHQLAGWLKIIPTILLVGVSGGLAVGNVGKDDDIDFFIICRNGTLWTTRFLTTLLLDILGKRRHPNDKNVKDKICLNMFVDETGMSVPERERDLYTAHEVVQMKPLWERKGIYQKFLRANKWINNQDSDQNTKGVKGLSPLRCQGIIENFLCWLQLKYMNKKRTSEKIELHRLLFHPQDKREWVIKEYKKRLKKYAID